MKRFKIASMAFSMAVLAACNLQGPSEQLPLVSSAKIASPDTFRLCVVEKLIPHRGDSFGQRTFDEVRLSDRVEISTYFGLGGTAHMYRFVIYDKSFAELRLARPGSYTTKMYDLEPTVFAECL